MEEDDINNSTTKEVPTDITTFTAPRLPVGGDASGGQQAQQLRRPSHYHSISVLHPPGSLPVGGETSGGNQAHTPETPPHPHKEDAADNITPHTGRPVGDFRSLVDIPPKVGPSETHGLWWTSCLIKNQKSTTLDLKSRGYDQKSTSDDQKSTTYDRRNTIDDHKSTIYDRKSTIRAPPGLPPPHGNSAPRGWPAG